MMKTSILSALMAISMLFSCSSQKKLVKDAPFQIQQPTFQKWVGGRAESGQGWKLQIPVEKREGVVLQKVYFRGMEAPVSLSNDGNQWIATANFPSSGMEKPDMVMHADSTKEVGNQPPTFQTKIPFDIDQNQCLLEYQEGNKTRYVKVSEVKEMGVKNYQ